MELEQKIERALGKLPQDFRPKCPVCASTLVFNGGRWKCRYCGQVAPS